MNTKETYTVNSTEIQVPTEEEMKNIITPITNWEDETMVLRRDVNVDDYTWDNKYNTNNGEVYIQHQRTVVVFVVQNQKYTYIGMSLYPIADSSIGNGIALKIKMDLQNSPWGDYVYE